MRHPLMNHLMDHPLRGALALTLAAPLAALLAAVPVHAQETDAATRRVLRLEATPIGALPQLSLPMPADRGHNYWGFRLQTGQRRTSGRADLGAVAAGLDLQWQGGSVFGVTAGWQARDCTLLETDCGGHPMFGARARMNFVTGASRIGEALGDHSASDALGLAVGVGWAPDVLPGMDACTIDAGAPFTMAMMQRIRLVTWVTPSIVWDLNCGQPGGPSRPNYLGAVGVGAQQLGLRGLDVYLGVQRIFRSRAGYQIGLAVTYIHLP